MLYKRALRGLLNFDLFDLKFDFNIDQGFVYNV